MTQSPNREKRILNVPAEGHRLDRFLAEGCPDLTRTYIQKLIRNGNVAVNGLLRCSAFRLRGGDVVEIVIPAVEAAILKPEDIPFGVIYEDHDIAVIDKPAGLTVHPAPGHGSHTLVNALLRRFPELASFDNSPRPGIVHRLDKDTSGLMVVAKNETARLYIVSEFKNRAVKKWYIALVKGKLVPASGAIEAPIGRDPADRKRMAVVSNGRDARTEYRVTGHADGYTLVDVSIQTGRTHQIRVHFAAIGHPVFGDKTYGAGSILLNRHFLHAHRLELRLPSTGEFRSFTSELPGDLEKIIVHLRQH